MSLLAQQSLDAIPASTLKWVLAILLVLLGVAGAVIFIIVSFRRPSPVKLDDAPPIEVRRAPTQYNHEATEARLAAIDRRLEAHALELRAIQEDRIKTLRHINQRFERVLIGIASIAGQVGAQLPAAEDKEN